MTDFPQFGTDDLAEFWPDEVPRFDDFTDERQIEAELCALPHLAADVRFDEPPTIERIFRAETAATAALTLREIPAANQATHLVINGRFALWDFVPAALLLAAPATISMLHLATLGFSRKNVQELTTLLDAHKIESVALLCSHYFKGTSGGIYEYALAELAVRRQRFASVRTHAKLVLARFTDGRTLTFESSANLRSCRNIEQVVVCGHPDLYRFHTQWIDELFP